MKMGAIKLKALFQIFLVATLSFIVVLPSIKAEASDINTCCKITNSNEFCVSGIKKDQCANGFSEFTTCENVPGCDVTSLGCCEIAGSCNSQTTEFSCKAVSGVFHKGVECGELSQCQSACCVVGSQCTFRPAPQRSAIGGIVDESATSDSSCIDICHSQDQGCCSESCTYGTKSECADENFYPAFCSGVSSCSLQNKAHASKDCGEDGHVYWVDSSGQREEIAEKCNPGLTSSETTSCSKKDGEAKCVSWDCKTTWDNPVVEGDGGSRKNGESWCEYQAAVGPTLDLPGTQHYLHSCVRGEEIVQSLGEKRENICMYGDLKVSGGISTAFPVPNSAAKCPGSTDQETCSKSGCVWIANEGAASIEKNKEDKKYHVRVQLYYNDETNFANDDYGGGSFIIGDEKTGDEHLYTESNGWDKLIVNGPTELSYSLNEAEIEKKYDNENDFKYELFKFEFDVEPGDYDIWIKNVDNEDEKIKVLTFSTDDIVSATEEKGVCIPLVPLGDSTLCEKGTTDVKNIGWLKDCRTCEWYCDSNCDIYSSKTKEAMNTFCNSYGDCGAKYNLAGEFSNIGFKRDCDPNKEDYSSIDKECSITSSRVKSDEVSFDIFKTTKGLFLGNLDAGNVQDSDYTSIDDGNMGVEGKMILGASQGAILGGAIGLFVGGPVGALIGAAIGAVVGAAIGFAIGGDDEKRLMLFSCKAWEPPIDSKDCSKCYTTQNKGGLLPDAFVFKYDVNNPDAFPQYSCTKTLCESLGSCEFVDGSMTNEGSKCLEMDLSMVLPPKIKYVSLVFECNDEEPGTVGGCSVKETSTGITITGMLKELSSVNITLKTLNKGTGKDELAICAYSTKFDEGFDDLVPNFDESGLMSVKHSLNLKDIKDNKTYSLQVFCQSGISQKKTTTDPFIITFEAAPQPDMMHPTIKKIIPENGKAFVPYGVTAKEVSLILDEDVASLGGCKWSREPGIDYYNMSHNFQCTSGGLNAYPTCKTMLSGIVEGEDNNYYFRCGDKSGNVHPSDWPEEGGVSVPYVVKASPSLNISSIRCLHTDGPDCTVPIYDKQFNLSVTTQEGAENGIANCSLRMSSGTLNPFLETGTPEHFQPGIKLSEGKHSLYLNCYDIAGNSAESKLDVEFKVDRDAPFIKSIYSEGANVKLSTDEKATCKYEWNSTVFNFNTALDISSSDKFLHSFAPETMSFIVACSDRFGNMNNPINVYLVK